jgi:taurine--2-oxoglutarate transaminase
METPIIAGNRAEMLQKNFDHTFFSWSKQAGLSPIHVSHAKGSYFYDANGKSYLDFSSQLISNSLGHGHPAITAAIVEQLQKVSFVSCTMTTDIRGLLGEKLASIAPKGLTKTLFTLGGSEAIENAVKLARIYTGRHKIIAHYRSYHGATYGAISVGGDPRRFAVDSQAVPNVVHVENPYSYRCPWGTDSAEACGEAALRNLEQTIIYENPASIAAILIEGESGTSGCIKYPPFYWRGVKAIAQKYGILTIADEVMSGFGRTGKWFGIDHHEVSPDMLCMAKGLTGAVLPLGALMVTDEIAKAFDDKVLPLGLTYSAHAVACAASLAAIEVYENEDLITQAASHGAYIDQWAEELKKRHVSIGDWRNTGMLGCFEMVKNRETKQPMAEWNCAPKDWGAMAKVAANLKEQGLFTLARWSYLFVAPPLNCSRAEIDEGMEKISKAMLLTDAEVQ